MDSRASRFDYVAVGHVTRDVIEDRGGKAVSQAGGGAFYSALQAARLGLRTLIVTQGATQEVHALLEPFSDELDLRVIPAKHTTTLSTRGSGAQRSQRLLAWAGPIVEPLTLDTRILHLAPVARRHRPAGMGEPISSDSRHKGSCVAGCRTRLCRRCSWMPAHLWGACRCPVVAARHWLAPSLLSIWTQTCSLSALARP